MRLELAEGGYEKIDAVITEIETLAMNGIFTENGSTQRFHKITGEVKKLRQIFRDVLLIDPTAVLKANTSEGPTVAA